MVRSVADRAFLPTKNLLEEVGDMMILTGKTIMSALRPPYPYGGEFVSQFLFALRLCWFPLLVSTVAFGYGAPGLQAVETCAKKWPAEGISCTTAKARMKSTARLRSEMPIESAGTKRASTRGSRPAFATWRFSLRIIFG